MNSKRVHFLALALTLSVLAGCVREQDPAAGQGAVMTIRASLPEKTVTRAGFSVPESEPGLHLAWQEGDCIRVISGSASGASLSSSKTTSASYTQGCPATMARSPFGVMVARGYGLLDFMMAPIVNVLHVPASKCPH